jgi:hypothetical protein
VNFHTTVPNNEKNQIENANYDAHSSNYSIDTITHKQEIILLYDSVFVGHYQRDIQQIEA